MSYLHSTGFVIELPRYGISEAPETPPSVTAFFTAHVISTCCCFEAYGCDTENYNVTSLIGYVVIGRVAPTVGLTGIVIMKSTLRRSVVVNKTQFGLRPLCFFSK